MRRLALLAYCIVGLCFSATPALAVDNRPYATLLSAHVHNGLVDYAGLQRDEAVLDQYLRALADIDADALSRDEAFAFYLNVYNAWTLKLILTRYPNIDSIKDLGTLWRTPWQQTVVRLRSGTATTLVTLDHIEHGILRPRFRDPRLHFAVNCASMGCPRLHNAPFEAATLQATLDRLTRANINDPAFNRLEGNTFHAIRVFDWFAEDWGDEAGIRAFLLHHAEPPLAQGLRSAGDRLRIRFTDWDWRLNKAHAATGGS
ncbi:DUF547 domain-containing protein [Megalodesulfovibrio paquesii]